MAAERFEIRIAGSGGQGVILATELIGQAITLYEQGLYVVQSQAYGPEARGGKSKAEVVVSHEPIDYPKVMAPNLQVILTQAAAGEFAPDTAPGGRIVYDDFFVLDLPGISTAYGGGSVEDVQNRIDARVYTLPIVRTARDKLGREIVTNMVALGCVGRVLDLEKIASSDSLRKAIADHFPAKKIAELNIQAFNEGYELFRQSPLP
ncbi:MAG: 2-oxoacid:acceptor oxidoreductase family protein [Synergistaceae bacterium]|jgi:2-oxoglutarate ferredoxin oxidoreductase subunit gamma|nr:2-oxoacid:acceptor oxidoreductase family protein [Synergistaceae bacterium]